MKNLGTLLLLILFGIAFSSCSDDENEKKEIEEKTVILTVASVPYEDQMTPYYVKSEDTPEWQIFYDIVDFVYEEGYEYEIEIIWNTEGLWCGTPPLAEANQPKLVKVISKTKKDSEGLPL